MTEHNLFQEVDDDIERQKLEEMWKRYGPWVLAAALVIVVATGGITSWRSWRTAKNQEVTAGLVHITGQSGDAGKQMGALEDFALKNPGSTPAALAELDAAELAAKSGDNDRAIQLYDEVAKDSKVDTSLRQFADLLSVRAQLDTGDPAALEKRLQVLAAEKAPWHYSAMEYEAYLALRNGDKATARKIFTSLSQDTGAPKDLGVRAADMLRYLSE